METFMIKAGTVSFWLGNIKSKEDLDALFQDTYTEDDNYIPFEFSRIFDNFKHSEPMVRERMYVGEPISSLSKVFDGFSYADIIIPQLINLPHKKKLSEYNALVLIYDFKYSKEVKVVDRPDCYFEFMGTAIYEATAFQLRTMYLDPIIFEGLQKKDILKLNNLRIILSETYDWLCIVNNIYALNNNNEIVWSVFCDESNIENTNWEPFIAIAQNGEHEILATDAEGEQYVINISNGEIIKKHCITPTPYATYDVLKELPIIKSVHLRDYNIILCGATSEHSPTNNIYAINRSKKLVWIVSCEREPGNINGVPFVDINITVRREILATDAEGIQYTIAAHNGNIAKKHT